MPKITIKRGHLGGADAEHDPWLRHRLAYNMGLWDFSYTYAVLTLPINQEIDGIKTFYNFPVLPVGFPTEDAQAANKYYADYVAQTSVTFENLFSNGDVGVGAAQVARGDHSHVNLPSDDQKDALDTSQSPDAGNPFVTYNQFESHANRHVTSGQDKIVNVSAVLPGLMSSVDKSKLDGVFESQATMYTHMSTLQVSAVLADTPYIISGVVEGYKTSDTNIIQVSGTNGEFTVGSSGTGRYFIEYNVSMETNKACTLHFHLFKNGVEQNQCSFERKVANANDVGNGSASTILNLSAGDVLNIRLESSAVNTTVTINHLNFTIMRTL